MEVNWMAWFLTVCIATIIMIPVQLFLELVVDPFIDKVYRYIHRYRVK